MSNREIIYIKNNFKDFLAEENENEILYRLTGQDSFELFKKYSHLYTYFLSGVITELSIFADVEEHVLEFVLKVK